MANSELKTMPTSMFRSPRRMMLATAGLLCVALGAVGAVLPGLPTTIFLILASYFFTRSCPWLEERLIRNRFFAPFLRYMDGNTPMPLRAKIVTIAIIWISVGISTTLLASNNAVPSWVVPLPPLAALFGTYFVARIGCRGNADGLQPEAECPRERAARRR
jgi:hypothetical protein